MVLLTTAVAAEVSFSSFDLSAANELLFTATADLPGEGQFRTLLYADLRSDDLVASAEGVAGGDVLRNVPMAQLTHYPEIFSYLPELQKLQIQNRFGLFRSEDTLGDLQPVAGFSNFVDGGAIPAGQVLPITTSPNGRFLLILEPDSAAYGAMVLLDLRDGTETVISERVELSLAGPPAAWSPDSRFFVYAQRGGIYYFSIQQLIEERVIGESYRRIGDGSLANVGWSAAGSLYYVNGSLVYRIAGAEFFARSLYQSLLESGAIAGKLPFPFDRSFDRFWISPDGRSVLLNKGGRNLFLLFLNTDDFADAGQIVSLPSLFLPRNTRVQSVLWSETDLVTVLTGSIQSGSTATTIYRLQVDQSDSSMSFQRLDDTGVLAMVISPDEGKVALLTATGVQIRSYQDWTQGRNIPLNNPLHAIWVDDQTIAVGGRSTIDTVDASDGSRSVIAFAQVDSYHIVDNGEIIASADDRWYSFQGGWNLTDSRVLPEASVSSSRYRIYTESISSGSYRNVVMVRRAQGVGTSRLFEPAAKVYEPFPLTDEQPDFTYFTHGSRIRRREVALVFNAVDSVEGLTEILTTLARFNVKATFFVNGEFIRRQPGALREISDGGHEVGSLFYAYFDMSDRRYRITEEFIRDGLARNEDDYFAATGRELSLIWHAPYYFVSDDVIAAGQSANYIYVSRDVDSLDWVPRRTDEGLSQLYMPSAELVERILSTKRPGSIISMQVGTPGSVNSGGREDFLFQRLDILINSLVDAGYDVVPVSALIDHAR